MLVYNVGAVVYQYAGSLVNPGEVTWGPCTCVNPEAETWESSEVISALR